MKNAPEASLALIIALGLAGPVLAGESMTASVRLNVRAGPGLEHEALDTLRKGERVLVTQCRDEWCQIVHVGINGWVYAPYLVSAQFSETWSARSQDLPATLPNETASGIIPDVSLELHHAHY